MMAGLAIRLRTLARPRPAERVSVAESMLAYYGDADLMRTLLSVPGRGAKWEAIAERVLGRTPA